MTWPWPGDTRTDRAQRCARWYRDLLAEYAPEACAELDGQLVDRYGQTWLRPVRGVEELDDWVTVDIAAEHTGVSVRAVYMWVYRDKIDGDVGKDGRLRVELRAALDYNAELRRTRAQRAS
ncbi:hypothetical protein EV383_4404 [Pseudonocardia sediminis]|uniref:Uncharacterized protein n=1 Tax=Pseudonocardia sediminis TaxID=1397368 RepID=A0A4Q7V4E6_PSEST|nr:hypothetical protein [Pseudonocardia sediminis]RZT87479.1 hypothetical protein EV383_4404 [Pseudonocardia sediminis]